MFCSILECYHYTFLNESSRANSFYNISIDFLCDDDLNGWYRFRGDAGKQMADSCVPEFRCGAELPGWLNGSHPEIAEGAVRRKVCFRYKNNCCEYSTSITVRNCGGFYVYHLGKPPICNFRYCGNGTHKPSENLIYPYNVVSYSQPPLPSATNPFPLRNFWHRNLGSWKICSSGLPRLFLRLKHDNIFSLFRISNTGHNVSSYITEESIKNIRSGAECDRIFFPTLQIQRTRKPLQIQDSDYHWFLILSLQTTSRWWQPLQSNYSLLVSQLWAKCDPRREP